MARLVHGAWGETLSSTESIPGLLETRFVGGLGVRNDSTTGLIYMRHRWYDPATGAFISRDPIGFDGGANRYRYVDNKPTSRCDPSGLRFVPEAASAVWKNGDIECYPSDPKRLKKFLKMLDLTFNTIGFDTDEDGYLIAPLNWKPKTTFEYSFKAMLDDIEADVPLSIVDGPVKGRPSYPREYGDAGVTPHIIWSDTFNMKNLITGPGPLMHEMSEAYFEYTDSKYARSNVASWRAGPHRDAIDFENLFYAGRAERLQDSPSGRPQYR